MTLPETMNVIEAPETGDADVLALGARPIPTPGPNDVLIEVAAAGVNRPDVLQRAGLYPPPPGASDLLGLEVSGTIAAVGQSVTEWQVGDAVCALAPGGGYAQWCAAPASHCLPVPRGLDLIHAAALPETFFTVWHNVFERGGLKSGETFLVHGGSGGIGTTAIQLAKQFGARVITTAGSPEKCAACESLGADLVINYRQQDWCAVVKKDVGKRGVDLILDMVGGDYVQKNLSCLAWDGRLVNIAFLNGSRVVVELARVMMKRQTLTGSTLRPQSDEAKAGIAKALHQRVWPLIEAGSIRPIVHTTFPLAEASAAHRLIESGVHVGKIVLTVGVD